MKQYEFIRLVVDILDLSQLNRFGSEGWHVVGGDFGRSVLRTHPHATWELLLEREIVDGWVQNAKAIEKYGISKVRRDDE